MDLFDLLVNYETQLWNHLDRGLRENGHPALGSLSALRIIARRGSEARVQDVADELAITVGAASRLIDRLEQSQLVQRAAHPTDRRSSYVSLTASGQSRLDAAVAQFEAEVGRQFAGISEADRKQLTSTLTTLNTGFSR